MSFGDTFWKVWQVRTSIKIQESIEDYFNHKPKFDNTTEIVQALVNNQNTWNRRIQNSREQVKNVSRSILCEYCNIRFNIYSKKDNTDYFSGLIFYNNIAYKTDEVSIVNVSQQFQNDSKFHPLFYCSKKCALEDKSITINEFK